jgi:carnitine-CoA ligase
MPRPPIVDLILKRRYEHPHDPFLYFGERTITWSDFCDCSFRTANGLRQLGIGPGDRVAIMLPNCPDYLFVYMGIVSIGAAPVPVNTAQRGATLAHILHDSEAKALVVDRPLVDVYLNIAAELEKAPEVVVRGRASTMEQFISLDRLMAADDVVPEVQEGAKSGLGILYTSGTTGPPKGVVATGYDIEPLHRLLRRLNVNPGETIYTALPLFHGNALIISAMGAIYNGWCLAIAERFSASRFWDDIRRYDAVEFNALGAIIPILLKQPQRADDNDNPTRVVLSAACPAWAWRDFERRFGIEIIEFYGLVDFPGFLVNDEGIPGCMGRPIGPTEFEVHDSEGAILRDTVGELVMKHPKGRLTRYHKQPEATDTAYRGGWFHTGDLARIDEDNLFYYCGRIKECMRRRGENISAWEIENVVNDHPAVVESAAHAVASDLGEDDVKLVAVLRPGISISPEELIDYCVGRMAEYAVPSYIEFRDAIPKTGTHRVQYATLKAEGITPATWKRRIELKSKPRPS